ncbi:hypothetical protein EDB81DRAFT_762211 [Dactylonectria macrodidyma]|uniref:Uncharacterized protein n=1 Tax=Dactylonectria macrodidyma TaxID=307937 RepID=A0A9P9J007_9HYPO|nr:hypothetical protein EDB81DRAFT_762211 [Dactylonectria macrodidyma]
MQFGRPGYLGLPSQQRPLKIAEIYKEFIAENQKDIEAEFSKALSNNVDFQKTISKIIADEISKRGGKVVRHQISDLVSQALHSSVASQISNSAATSIGSGVGASIIHALVPALSHVWHIAIAKAVGTVVMTKILALVGSIIAHSVATMVGAAMVVAFAHAMGSAAASSLLGPAAWLIGGSYALYKILTLPKTLGKKLGVAVQDQLNGNFKNWAGNAFDKAFKELLNPTLWSKGLINDMADEGIFDAIDEKFDHPLGGDPDSTYKHGAKVVHKGVEVGNGLVWHHWK